jgi:predicted amidohydrolase
VSEYRKLHLFDIDLKLKGCITIDENRYIEPGIVVVDPIFSPLAYIGLAISNDLRYTELFRRLVVGGA